MLGSRPVILTVAAAAALVVSASVAVAASGGHQPPTPGVRTPDAVAAAQRAATETAYGQDLYTSVRPCRAVNTHAGKPVPAKAVRTFYVAGTSGFRAQGGPKKGCGIPRYASSVAATVTSVRAAGNGILVLFPAGSKAPATTSLSFRKGQQASAGAQVSVRPGAARQLAVRSSAKTDVTVDVVGYYSPQIYGTFTDGGALYRGNGTLTGGSHSSTGYFTLDSDRDLTGCAATASSYYYTYNVSAYTDANHVYVQMSQYNGTPADYYFQVHVTC